MTELGTGVLDDVVKEVTNNSEFLTARNIEALKSILPEEKPEDDGSGGVFDIKQVLTRMERQFTKALNATSTAGSGTLDFQRVQQMGTKLLQAWDEYAEKIKLSERHRHVEDAIIETLDQLGNEQIKARYMELLAENLNRKPRKA